MPYTFFIILSSMWYIIMLYIYIYIYVYVNALLNHGFWVLNLRGWNSPSTCGHDFHGPALRAKTMREDRFKRLVDNVCDHGGKSNHVILAAAAWALACRSFDGLCRKFGQLWETLSDCLALLGSVLAGTRVLWEGICDLINVMINIKPSSILPEIGHT